MSGGIFYDLPIKFRLLACFFSICPVSYRPSLYRRSREQQEQAGGKKSDPGPVRIQIVRDSEFYPAEDYHQDYYKKNPIRYKVYRYGCGRDQRLQDLWGSEKK